MTTIHLVRHAVHDLVADVLVGRNADVTLNAAGQAQALALAAHFAGAPIAAIRSSPQPRALATARPIAERHGQNVMAMEELDELDMGDWTGRAFAGLQDDPLWRLWNAERGAARPPRGESMRELQQRALRHLARVRAEYPGESVVIVTHAELIRAVLLDGLGRSLDDWSSVPIDPASVTTLHPAGCGITINRRLEEFVAA